MRIRAITITKSVLDAVFTAGLALAILYLVTLNSFVISFLVIFISLIVIQELETHSLQGKLTKIALISAVVAFISTSLGVNLTSVTLLSALELTIITTIVIYVYEAYVKRK